MTQASFNQRSLFTVICEVLANFRYLAIVAAPLTVYIKYASNLLGWQQRRRYGPDKAKFKALLASGKFSNDWFSGNIPYWLPVLEKYGLTNRPIKALEIGSWEGASSVFILDHLPLASLVCVDTWEGADEHKGQDILNRIEDNFDRNLASYGTRLTKFKGTSFAYFNTQPERSSFDLIYVDGSHHSDDVIVDAIKSFELLKVGGIMIFDDYFWRLYNRDADNPARAIIAFLYLKDHSCKIETTYHQMIVVKTNDRKRT